MQEDDEKRSFLKRYWWVFIGAVGAVGLATALNFTSVDGWIEIIDYGNDTYDLGWNTTRPTVCAAGNYSYWTGTTFLCSPDTTGGGSNSSDGNNYTTSQSFEYSGNNVILQTARSGASNVSAFFTFQSSTGILLNNGVFYTNATNCSSGQYSRYENNGWNCYNDASGGSGTVTSVALNSTTNAVSITGSPIVNAGTLVFEIRNATTLVDGLMTSVQATSLASKALAGNCVGYNSTHVNVTMNATTAGVECVAVALNPGGSSFDPSGLYVNVTDLQNSNASTNTRIDDLNLSKVATGDCTTPGQFGYQFFDTNINCAYVNFSYLTSVPSYLLNYYANITALQLFRDAIYLNVTSLQANSAAYYQNITDLQNSNTSTNTRINTINTTVQNLLSSNTSIYTRIDTVNLTTQNLLASNTSLYALILQLGQNDTNLNASINAVNTRVTTTNNSLQLALVNITDLQNSNASVNVRINTLNTTIQNLLSSNGSVYTRIDTLNTSISSLSTFAQTKAATGYSGDCPTGIAGITLNNGSAPNKTCAPAQGGGDAAGVYQNITDLQIRAPNTTTLFGASSFPRLEQEFTHVTSTSAYGYLGSGAISSGTVTILTGLVYHPGILSISDSTTAGGGYFVRTAATSFLMGGGEFFNIVLRAPGGKAGETTIAAGFLDSGTTINAIAEGCYFVYNLTQNNSRSINGRCRNVSTQTVTSTSYTATNNTWYVLNGYLSGTVMNFTITNGTGTILWSDNVSTNTPQGNAFRDTGFGVIAVQNTTDAATSIAHVDYVAMGINRSLPRY